MGDEQEPGSGSAGEAPAEGKAEGQSEGYKFRFGCLERWFAMGVMAIAGGSYLMAHWNQISGGGKTAAVMFIVIGTVLVLPMVLYLGFKLFLHRAVGRLAKDLKKAGKDMLSGNQAMYGQVHEFRPAAEEDFQGLDRDLYQKGTVELEGRGFRLLGDLVDQTIENLGKTSPPIRLLASADGRTTAAMYHLVIGRSQLADDAPVRFYFDLATELTDGTFVCTSNTKESNLMTPPPGLHQTLHPLATPLAELLAAHEAERDRLLAANPGLGVMEITTLADAIASEKRQQAVKNAFRKQIGYVDPEEVRRVANQTEAGSQVADTMAAAADRARKEEQNE